MKKLILVLCTLFIFGCEEEPQKTPENQQIEWIGKPVSIDLNQQTVQIEDRVFSVEIADEHKERRQGLMFRESLAKDAGMLFVFEKTAIYPFWMKNTLIPLYMIWISEDLTVVDMQRAVPCKTETCPQYVPSGMAKYVLEILG